MRFVALVASLALFASAAGNVLFPTPIHVIRETSDSVSQSVQRIDEYCDGDRIVAVSGDRTVVTDYRARTVTRIDRRAGTYNIAAFESSAPPTAHAKASKPWKSLAAAPETIASRSADVVELAEEGTSVRRRIRIAATSEIRLSREAAEVMIGSAYPAPRHDAADAVLEALRIPVPKTASASAPGSVSYRLPLETVTSWDVAGESAELRTRVLSLSDDRVPVELASIPPGARRVEPPPDPGAALLELEQSVTRQAPRR